MEKIKAMWLIACVAVVLLGASMSVAKENSTHSAFAAATITESSKAREDSEEAFHLMMDVLTHQRCVNCHPSDNVPKQAEDRHPHRFGISRVNAEGATNCGTCHGDTNNNYSGVPGAPHWALAPESMAWEGLDRFEIARSMIDRAKNGNRSADDIMHHLTEHELVLWAWEPGLDAEGQSREVPPVSKEEFIRAVKEWVEAGAIIPVENTED